MVQLSKLIAGTMHWGSWGKNLSTKGIINLIEAFVNEDITTFDHADIYGNYTTEAAIGKAFKQSNILREKLQFITKCGIKLPSENRNYSLKFYDYSEKHLTESVENSLRNLQTDYLDALLLHRPSPLMQPKEIANVIEKLKKEGKIISFGVSNFNAMQTQLIQKYTDVDFNQIQFSLTKFEAMNNGDLDFMQINNIKPMAWNPLGNYFSVENLQNKKIKKTISNLVYKYNVAEDLLLLKWISTHPAKILPVLGTTNLERIKSLNNLNNFELTTEDWFALYEASLGNEIP